MFKAYFGALQKYATFSGRARRKEAWMFFLGNLLVAAIIGAIAGAVGGNVTDDPQALASLTSSVSSIYSLFIFLPSLALTVRRLHDTGKSGWFVLWDLLPIIGWLIVFVRVYCKAGDTGSNVYGDDPKA